MADTPWTPHTDHASYWRSDNPFIIAWYRFGDDDPNSVELKVPGADYASGLLVDSGPRQMHLLHRGTPDSFLKPVSGVAPWSTSGVIFGEQPSTSWVAGAHGDSLWIDVEAYHEAGSGGSRGMHMVAYGLETHPSGWSMMGWLQIPEETTNPSTERQIWGDEENAGGSNTFSDFSLRWRPSDNTLHVDYRLNGEGSYRSLDSTSDPFPPVNDEPFFVAVQLHREIGVAGGWKNAVQGSGAIKLWQGTANSGLRLVAETVFIDNDTRIQRKVASQNFFTFAQDSISSRTTTTSTQHLPPESRLDEFVFVSDGFIQRERLEHYMNSGIQHVVADDPLDVGFIPINAGQDDLKAYWTFDDQTGTNSAPATSGGPPSIDVQMNPSLGTNIAPVAGVRGGSGIRVGLEARRQVALSNPQSYAHVIYQSGINTIFPDINVSDQWTWIGWVRARQDGSNHYGGVVGFLDGNTSHNHTAWGIGDWTNAFASSPTVDRGRGIEFSSSGTSTTASNGPNSSSSEVGGNLIGPLPNAWQLWALVFDFRHGLIYSVRDAKNIRLETERISSVSGLSKDEIALTTGAWVFAPIEDTNVNRYCEFDDWAIYSRKLTLPEMSGYALSGIAVTPFSSPYGVADVRTFAYYRLNNSGVYTDPSGESRLRYNDSSFYIHNCSTVSGTFSQVAALNTRTDDDATKIEQSGSMLGLQRVEHGANLDFSQRYTFAQSGFSCGLWLSVPSGDFGDPLLANTSGLDGDHHLMGAWSQASNEQAWQLGIADNKAFIRIKSAFGIQQTLTASEDIPFNTKVFIGAQVFPSGAGLRAEIFTSTNVDNQDLRLIASTTFTSEVHLQPVGASGFSMFNVPNRAQGFPSGTIAQNAFVYAGPVEAEGFDVIKRNGFNKTPVESGGVSTSDPFNVSHWRLDLPGRQFRDYGKQQNYLHLVNNDNANATIVPAIHLSGVSVREPEYLDTLPNNPAINGLNLGSGTSDSYTILGWMKPNSEPSVSQDEYLVSKHAERDESYQMFMSAGSNFITMNSAGIETSGNNSELLERDRFNHVAFIHDKDNNRQTVIINGRYAGSAFTPLKIIPDNTSGFVLGGRGNDESEAIAGGGSFSGIMDDWMVFGRALSLPEVSGLAANSYNYAESSGTTQSSPIGAWISGIPQNIVSGLIGAWIHGQAQDIELAGAYMTGISGFCTPFGGYMRGLASVSGFHGGFVHGLDIASGVFGTFIHGLGIISGVVGSYTYGACQADGQFDLAFTFQIVSADDFDAKLAVEVSKFREFDSRLGVVRITAPPTCTLELPYPETVVSGLPYTLTVQGSGAALDGKVVDHVRFTFADFKGAASGTLIDGHPQSGFYSATRVIDTQGLYTVKIEVIDDFGYRTTCAQQILIIGSGDTMPTSGQVLAGFPGFELTATPVSGVTKEIVAFTHSLSGLDTTSGILEYMDFSNGQESLVNSTEMPDTNIFGKAILTGVRQHEYSMAGKFTPVWAASGSWGIVSDTIAPGLDFQNF